MYTFCYIEIKYKIILWAIRYHTSLQYILDAKCKYNEFHVT